VSTRRSYLAVEERTRSTESFPWWASGRAYCCMTVRHELTSPLVGQLDYPGSPQKWPLTNGVRVLLLFQRSMGFQIRISFSSLVRSKVFSAICRGSFVSQKFCASVGFFFVYFSCVACSLRCFNPAVLLTERAFGL